MPTDHRAQVEEMLAEYRRSRDRLASVQRELATIEETAASADRTVRVTVGSQGALSDVRLTDDAYRRHSPSELAALIVRLSGEAARAASERARAVLEPALPAGTDPAAVLDGRADLPPAEPDGASTPAAEEAVRDSAFEAGDSGGENSRPRASENRDFENGDFTDDGTHSWLRGSTNGDEQRTYRGRRTRS